MKVRERERGVGRLGFGGVSSADQESGASQSRNSSVVFSRSGGKFGSDFKLEVCRKSAVHYVFLDAAQLKWMEGVLKVARDANWIFPRGCITDSSRRRIVLARCRVGGEPVLRVSECCALGKVFFVDISGDSGNRGWGSFLSLIRDACFSGTQAVQPSTPSARKSYAEALGVRDLSQKGKCVVEKLGGEIGITVSHEGVKERLDFLNRCVVFRLVGDGEVCWNEFKAWVVRYWGVPGNPAIRPLGDDLWLMECASEKEVDRIVNLGRWRFKDFAIHLDKWIKVAGRSNVRMDSDVAWLVVRGIPLHLRSSELVRSLGEACGGFLASADGPDMSSVRIKVKLRGPVPEEIPLFEGLTVFPVKVDFEADAPVPAHEERFSTEAARKGKQESLRGRSMPARMAKAVERCSWDLGESSAAAGGDSDEGSSDPKITEVVLSNRQSIVGGHSFGAQRGYTKEAMLLGREGMGTAVQDVWKGMGARMSAEGLLVGNKRFSLMGFNGNFSDIAGAMCQENSATLLWSTSFRFPQVWSAWSNHGLGPIGKGSGPQEMVSVSDLEAVEAHSVKLGSLSLMNGASHPDPQAEIDSASAFLEEELREESRFGLENDENLNNNLAVDLDQQLSKAVGTVSNLITLEVDAKIFSAAKLSCWSSFVFEPD
ncbi:hypothetical protein LINPERHAP2_LOCUS12476 [Linum perenne]